MNSFQSLRIERRSIAKRRSISGPIQPDLLGPKSTSRTPANRHRSGSATSLILSCMALGAMVVGGLLAYFYYSDGSSKEIIDPILATIERGDFISQVLDQGEVQSSENVEIRCEVRARNGATTVLSAVREATLVEAGDFLVQLDSTSFEKELEEQNIAMANAETSVIQAESTLASAEATLREYVEGTFEQEKLTMDNEIKASLGNIETAKQRRQQAKDTYEHSRKLQVKGFITSQALQAAEFDLNKAQIELDQANNEKILAYKKLEVLVNITKDKNLIQLNADIKAAKVKLDSDLKARVVEKQKLEEIELMVSKCRIVVPEGVSGQVNYARESSRGREEWELEEGASVRENQVLIRLPNPSKMEVKTLINEQSITRIEPGMACTVRVDALNNERLTGVVTRVNQYAESSRYMSSSVRKYAVLVKIFDPPKSLKPGMNASVTIQVQYEPDVLLAPIQSVYAVQEQKFCLVKNGDQWETREIQSGGDNSQQVLIKSGLEEGEVLVMNPGAYKHLMDLPEAAIDSKLELPPEQVAEAKEAAKENKQAAGLGGPAGFQMPANGSAMMAEKDSDGDGKLSKEEVGMPVSRFFERADADSDGFLSQAETDAALKLMKDRPRRGGDAGKEPPRDGPGGQSS